MLMEVGTKVKTTAESGVEKVLHGVITKHTGEPSMPYRVDFGDGKDTWVYENDIEEDKEV